MERQIRLFREVIEGPGFHKCTPTDFEMITMSKKTEYVMNCKPLARYLGNKDDTFLICPIDLMTGFLEPISNEILFTAPRDSDDIRRGYGYTKKICSESWDRWITSYLTLMQQTAKWTMIYRNF